MEFTARQVADLLKGEVEGNEEVVINTLSKIQEGAPNSISFLYNPDYTKYIYITAASAVIVSKTFQPTEPLNDTLTLIRVDDPRASFGQLLQAYQQFKNSKTGIEQPCYIASSAKVEEEGVFIGANAYIGENSRIGKHVRIAPGAYIGQNVTIKDHTHILAGAIVHDDCEIGAHCTLHSNVVIGGDGFGFIPNSENNYQKIVHIGNVILEDHVEIGSNTTIDRGTIGSTIIRKGVKLDNLIQIAHNVEIGENTVMAAQCGVAGSTVIGKNCMIGGQVGIIGHITIADEVKIAAQSGIGHSITEKGALMQGSPAINAKDFKRSYVVFRDLPNLRNTVKDLEKKETER